MGKMVELVADSGQWCRPEWVVRVALSTNEKDTHRFDVRVHFSDGSGTAWLDCSEAVAKSHVREIADTINKSEDATAGPAAARAGEGE